MSGGHFDYIQFNLEDVIDKIETVIKTNGVVDWYNYSENTLAEFRVAIDVIKKASIYLQRIDWLVSGDDGEDTFHKRLKEDLSDGDTIK